MVDAIDQKGFPNNWFIDRIDEHKWRVFEIGGGYAVITQEGQNLIKERPEVLKRLREYKFEASGFVAPEDAKSRSYLKSGGNSDVYSLVGQDIVIKEASRASGFSVELSLERLDYLYSICEKELFPEIRVPKHFGAIVSRDLKKQYLIMEQINAGLSTADILNPDIDPKTQNVVMQHFKGNKSFGEIKHFVESCYDDAKDKLDKLIGKYYSEGKIPTDDLLTDWAYGNVLVDFDNPISEEKPFTLWVIDQ